MGWLSNLIGSPDDDLMATGELARGNITAVRATGMTLQVMNGLVERSLGGGAGRPCESGTHRYRFRCTGA